MRYEADYRGLLALADSLSLTLMKSVERRGYVGYWEKNPWKEGVM